MVNYNKEYIPEIKASLIGIGLDKNEHKRVTKGDNFYLYGGS